MYTERFTTKEDVLAHFDYDREAGTFRNKYNRASRSRIGDDASYIIVVSGFERKLIHFQNHKYFTAKLVYLVETGESPKYIYYQDGDRTNTRFSNLIASDTKLYNNPYSSNTSGFRNVCRDTAKNRWAVSFKINGKNKFVFSSKDLIEAALFAIDYRRKLTNGKF